ncbi:NTR domain-containing protein-like [Ostrea edulis]|uniref:NTR domain-containing protein-like n=1 Tax=Ostrea edulis TaxID=37623 RepID=UPI0020961288|nr:NTR domain-containing protein-like [Ostrea edulis]
MEKSAKLTCLVVGFLAVCIGCIHTCSCYWPDPLENGCRFDYSLRGVVLNVRNVNGRGIPDREYLVYVQRYYKAIPRRPRFVRIRSARQGASCGVQLQRGERYVISGSVNGRRLRTNLCTYTRTWDRIPYWQQQNQHCHLGVSNQISAPS